MSLARLHKAIRTVPGAVVCAVVCACALTLPAHAAGPDMDQRLLGWSEAALTQAYPAARKLPKPRRGPRGERGLWALAGTELAGQAFEATFYFRAAQLRRIEQSRSAPGERCDAPLEALLGALDARHGPGVRADDGALGRSSVWVVDGVKVSASANAAGNACELRVAYEPSQEKDASEL